MVKRAVQGKKDSSAMPCQAAVEHFRQSLEGGRAWLDALLEAMSLWTSAEEVFQGKRNRYLIDGEAFDWPLLAERLCAEGDGLVPEKEKRALLDTGRLPANASDRDFKRLLGSAKYRAYLNFYYGVIVEKALLEAAEDDIKKARLAKGYQDPKGVSEDAFFRVYHSSKDELMKAFRKDKGYSPKKRIGLAESKAFTYWLFKHRLNNSDKARLASDTKKGLERLHHQGAAVHLVNSKASAEYEMVVL